MCSFQNTPRNPSSTRGGDTGPHYLMPCASFWHYFCNFGSGTHFLARFWHFSGPLGTLRVNSLLQKKWPGMSGTVSDGANDNDRDSPRVLKVYAVHGQRYLRQGMCPSGIMQS